MRASILIVEDHDTLRKALRQWLEVAFPCCYVLEAASGEEALPLVRARAPHVVIMDIGLPGMSGIEATRRIKSSLPATHVVVLTMYEDEASRAAAARAGASSYVVKRTMEIDLLPVVATLLPGQKEPETKNCERSTSSFPSKAALNTETAASHPGSHESPALGEPEELSG
jgi:two-component system invasion response regulator UvrY